MIIVITDVAILVAAKNFVSPKFPIKPVSTIPTSGTAIFPKKTGMDSKKICFFELLAEYLLKFKKGLSIRNNRGNTSVWSL